MTQKDTFLWFPFFKYRERTGNKEYGHDGLSGGEIGRKHFDEGVLLIA